MKEDNKPRNYYKHWSSDETEFLKNNYPKLSMQNIAKILNRSVRAVESRIGRLGLYSTNRAKLITWSSDEVKFLKENYLKLSLREIAKSLNRSIGSVGGQSRRLKLRQQEINNIKPLKLAETEKAYIAGFLDGDGSVRISIHLRNGKPRTAIASVEISNSNRVVLEWIAEQVNRDNRKIAGLRYYTERRFTKPLDMYYLKITGRLGIEPFLQLLLPYLHVKLEAAQNLLQFLQSRIPFKPYTLEDWRNVLKIREAVGSRKDADIRSREALRHFIKEQEQNQ